MDIIFFLLFSAITIIVTFITGTVVEKSHFNQIKKREIALIRKPIVNYGIKKWAPSRKVKSVQLVTGEVVISGDYFKNFVANMKNFFGGRLTTFESILDRGRREAVLRMREKAIGANLIVNTRIESIMVNDTSTGDSIPQCAIIAYGTAITYE